MHDLGQLAGRLLEQQLEARCIGTRLGQAKGPACLLLPLRGIEQWDQPGEPLHDPEGLAAFVEAMRGAVAPVRVPSCDAYRPWFARWLSCAACTRISALTASARAIRSGRFHPRRSTAGPRGR